LSGQSTDAEKEDVEQWIKEKPEHASFIRSVRQIWDVTPREKDVDVQAAWSRFQSEKMGQIKVHKLAENRPYPHRQSRNTSKWKRRMPAFAAAAIIVLLTAVLFVIQNQLAEPDVITYQKIITQRG